MTIRQETAVIIVAAGSGVRAGTGAIPKQYQNIGGKPMLARTLDRFLDHGDVDSVRVVIGADHVPLYNAVAPRHPKLHAPILGGETRQASVLNGLSALAKNAPARVLIHDAARPFTSAALIARVAEALARAPAVVPAMPVASTLKQVAAGRVLATVPRDGLQAAETPQGFDFATIHDAHQKAVRANQEFTDDAAVAEWAGVPVLAVAGDPGNVKLTTGEDIAAADRRLTMEDATRLGDVRVGFGFDVHPLGSGSQVHLGGVAIPHTRGLIGHSDADVVLHALTDAVLGAIAEGDIGAHFPPSDERWRGAASDQFLAHAVARVRARGGIVAHLDVTYIGEGPRLAPHRDAIRARIAEICGIDIGRVGMKATTNEGLGFLGRGEGAAAHAVATIRLPFAP